MATIRLDLTTPEARASLVAYELERSPRVPQVDLEARTVTSYWTGITAGGARPVSLEVVVTLSPAQMSAFMQMVTDEAITQGKLPAGTKSIV